MRASETSANPRIALAQEVDVGPLAGLTSFCLRTGAQLKSVTKQIAEGHDPSVVWNLNGLRSPHMSMAALTAFLATAARLRPFLVETPNTVVPFNPRVLKFLSATQFFSLAEETDLFRIPDDFAGIRRGGAPDPTTIFVRYAWEPPLDEPGSRGWNEWKDSFRQRVTGDLAVRCGRVFKPYKSRRVDPELRDKVTHACAELVVNAVLWGDSPAWVGLQRSRVGITVAVCDSGPGFRRTINRRLAKAGRAEVRHEGEALVLGSLITANEIGLRGVIEKVINAGGWVHMSSGNGILHWKRQLWWEKVAVNNNPLVVLQHFGDPTTGPITPEMRDRGYMHELSVGVRGVRISFEVPAQSP